LAPEGRMGEMKCIHDIGRIILYGPRFLGWAMWPIGLLFWKMLKMDNVREETIKIMNVWISVLCELSIRRINNHGCYLTDSSTICMEHCIASCYWLLVFFVPHLLWHGVSVFPVSSKGPPHSVASYPGHKNNTSSVTSVYVQRKITMCRLAYYMPNTAQLYWMCSSSYNFFFILT
jgi:hypothetical protein